MLTKVQTSVISGIKAIPVQIEVQVQNGLPRFSIIGLADSAVREARDRVISALSSVAESLPDQILINLSPAEVKKSGVCMDLAMAVAVAVASGMIDLSATRNISFIGELGLDGTLKVVQGALAHAVSAQSLNRTALVVPDGNEKEAALIADLPVYYAGHIGEVIEWLRGEKVLRRATRGRETHDPLNKNDYPFEQIIGQEGAKRALEIAAVGGHHVLLVGPPGCGKTMLAERFPRLLPALSREELLEVAGVHSVSGQDISSLLRGTRPFRAPHYGISTVGLVGGGSVIRPGEITLAHRGVLFLDEFPEYTRSCLEALRIPLEKGAITISRSKEAVTLPARFQLIAAMNPCPCGRGGENGCTCSQLEVHHYLRKLSQPILDRIDMHASLKGVSLANFITADGLSTVRGMGISQLEEARLRAKDFFGILPSSLESKELSKIPFNGAGEKFLQKIIQAQQVSVRAFHRVLKVSLSIAACNQKDFVDDECLAEACSYRPKLETKGQQVFTGAERPSMIGT